MALKRFNTWIIFFWNPDLKIVMMLNIALEHSA